MRRRHSQKSGATTPANDDPAQILTGASQRLFYDVGRVTSHGAGSSTYAGSGAPSCNTGHWTLVIEATMFVTYAVVNVWTGVKAGGNDPTPGLMVEVG